MHKVWKNKLIKVFKLKYVNSKGKSEIDSKERSRHGDLHGFGNIPAVFSILQQTFLRVLPTVRP